MKRANQMTPNRELLEAALRGFELQRESLDERIIELHRELGKPWKKVPRRDWVDVTPPGAPGIALAFGKDIRKRAAHLNRKMSPEGRERLVAAQRKRWAAFHKTQRKAQKAA